MGDTDACQEIRDLLPELAAGVADGNARAVALAHLARCADCSRELHETTVVLDQLILLAPEHEPSPGFETSVLNALAPERRRPLRALAFAAAAAVLAALLAGSLVWRDTSDDRQLATQYRKTLAVADGRYLTAAEISTAAKAPAGHAFAYQGEPSWVFVTLESAPSSGNYRVQIVTDDNDVIDVGWCPVRSGKGSWGTTIPVPIRDISRIEMSRAGAATMSADFG